MTITRSEPPVAEPPTAAQDRFRPVTVLWLGHGVLRAVLLYLLLSYAWAKLFGTQMPRVDEGSALGMVGEKSPMSLLWTFMGYSPLLQFLAGLAEMVAAVLLIWRRTAWVGGLVGTVSMGVVCLLNMIFDVPVKQLTLVMAVGFLLVASPELPRLFRFVAGRPTGAVRPPRPIPWPRVHAVTRWILAFLGFALVAYVGVFVWHRQPPQELVAAPQPGVYRVVADATPPSPQLAGDRRWQEIALGQWNSPGRDAAPLSVRYADGSLQQATYRTVPGGGLEVAFSTGGTTPPGGLALSWSPRPDGRVALAGGGQQLLIEPAPKQQTLFDHRFSWASPSPFPHLW